MKKAVVLEIKEGFAAVLTDEGFVQKIRDENYTVGQEIELSASDEKIREIDRTDKSLHGRPLRRWYRAAAAAAAVFVISGSGLYYASENVFAYSTVTVTTEDAAVELTLNKKNEVVGVKPLDKKSGEAVAGMAVSVRKRETLSDALDKITEGQVQAEVSVSSRNDERRENLLKEVKEMLPPTELSPAGPAVPEQDYSRPKEAGIIPEQSNEAGAGTGPEQPNESGIRPDKANMAGGGPEQPNEAGAGTGPEQPNESGIRPDKVNMAGGGPEQPGGAGAGTGSEQPNESGIRPDKANMAGIVPEQQNEAGAGIVPEQPNGAGAGPEQTSVVGAVPEQPGEAGGGQDAGSMIGDERILPEGTAPAEDMLQGQGAPSAAGINSGQGATSSAEMSPGKGMPPGGGAFPKTF